MKKPTPAPLNFRPKVSVIVPVFNTAPYLRQCLDSLTGQTLRDIEIICVDDGSTDESPDILREYEAREPHLKALFHECNRGLVQTRKTGAACSNGDYVMFLDSDDEFFPRACETAYAAIEQRRTDMLQFGTQVVNCNNVPQSRLNSMLKFTDPCLERIEGDLILACWEKRRFGFNLWNKIYRGDLCRRAFSFVQDAHVTHAEDLYIFFIIASMARSYMGISDVLHRYNFGRGGLGHQETSLPRFDGILNGRLIAPLLSEFLKQKGLSEKYQNLVLGIEKHLLLESVTHWKEYLSPSDAPAGFCRLARAWGFEKVLGGIAEKYWHSRSEIMQRVRGAECFQHQPRPQEKRKTIAAYYRCISNGGAQRVVAALCSRWSELRDKKGNPLYNAILITDEPGTSAQPEAEYPLPPAVKRVFLPRREDSTAANYRLRAAAWERILTEHRIDIVVDSQWVDACTPWDMLCVKGHPSKPAFVLHCHNFCAVPYGWGGDTAQTLVYEYQFCDGAVTLSEADQRFVSAFSPHSRCIPNPLTFLPDDSAGHADTSRTLLWTGRLSPEKRPLDLIKVMKIVAGAMPDTKLLIVGSGKELESVRDLAECSGVSENVVFTGFSDDVQSYYRQGAVFINTSEFEGFSLTIAEAMAHALPVVSYDMPWLTLFRDGRGIVAVPQGRFDLLAAETIRLLQDPQRRREIGLQGQKQIRELSEIDIAREWKIFFDEIERPDQTASKKSRNVNTENLLFSYLTLFQQKGKKAISDSLNACIREERNNARALETKKSTLNKRLLELEQDLRALQVEHARTKAECARMRGELGALRASRSFRIGRAATWIPRKVRGGIRCWRDHGLLYTFKRAWHKIQKKRF